MFYIMMTALEDEQTQKLGIVMVGYNCGPNRTVDRKSAFAIQSLRRHLPMRMVSIHYCYDDFKMRPMMTIAMLVMGASQRVRFRAHFGTLRIPHHQRSSYMLWIQLTFSVCPLRLYILFEIL